MEHIGIDLGSKKSHIAVKNTQSEKGFQTEVPTAELGTWLKMRAPGRVVMESCTQSIAVSRMALTAGHETIVIPGHAVRALGVGRRGIKTDTRDAEVLANASVRNPDLPTVHLRSITQQEMLERMSARSLLVENRTKIINHLKGYLRSRLITVRATSTAKSFPDAIREVLLQSPEGIPSYLEAMLRQIESLNEEITALSKEAETMAKQSPLATRLMGICGVGPMVSLGLMAYVDDISRFGSAEALTSYLGLVPGECTTGGRIKRTGTIRTQNPIKPLLIQAAWCLWRTRPNEPMVEWARKIGDKRGIRIAIVALARKLASVMYGMWKHGTQYDPQKAVAASNPKQRHREK
jgi:transposase